MRSVWQTHTHTNTHTLGHMRFKLEVEQSLNVLDGTVAVFDSVVGMEPQTGTMW